MHLHTEGLCACSRDISESGICFSVLQMSNMSTYSFICIQVGLSDSSRNPVTFLILSHVQHADGCEMYKTQC